MARRVGGGKKSSPGRAPFVRATSNYDGETVTFIITLILLFPLLLTLREGDGTSLSLGEWKD